VLLQQNDNGALKCNNESKQVKRKSKSLSTFIIRARGFARAEFTGQLNDFIYY
jgi:hypothetical protein